MLKSFQQLAKTYDGFSAPAADVKIDNKSIMNDKNFAVTEIKADLDIRKANAAQIALQSTDDESDTRFKSLIEKKVMLGSTVEIRMGYGSSLETVFYGVAERIDFNEEEDGAKGALIYAFDVRRMMMSSVRDKTYEGTLKSGIIQQVFSEYKKVCPTLSCEVTGSIDGNVTQNCSDYDFIMKYLLGSESPKKDFYVAGKKAYIKTAEAGMLSCVAQLEKGEGLYSFSDSGRYLNSEVEVHGYDADKGKSFSASAKAKAKEKQKTLNSLKKILGSQGIMNESEAKKIAERITEEMKKNSGGGQAECVGIPDLIPGSSVKLVVKDMGISDYYLIKGAVHSFSSGGGYSTVLRFGKDELSEVLSGETAKSEADRSEIPKAKEEGIMLGKVVENWDDKNPDKLLVELAIGETGKTRTEWIPYITPYAGKDFGLCFRPEKGSQVAAAFLSGDKNMPVVLGVMRADDSKAPKDTLNKENDVKAIITKAGHKVIFSEKKDEASLEIVTSGGLKIFLDDKNNSISLQGKSDKNKIVINEKESSIEIKAEKKIVLSAGTKSKLEIGESEITAEGGKITVTSSGELKLKGSQTGVEGSGIEVKASGSLKLQSSGSAEIKGSLLKLN